MENKHNRNYQRIDNAIVGAYKKILENRGTPDVSITTLCKNAGVNRTTFYKHYKGVYEIAQQIEDELLYHLFNVDKISMDEFLDDPKPALDRLNENLLKNLAYYKCVLRPERRQDIIAKVVNILFKEFQKQYPKSAKNKDLVLKAKINITDFVGAVANLYIQWMNGYFSCDITEISEHIAQVLKYVYKNVNL